MSQTGGEHFNKAEMQQVSTNGPSSNQNFGIAKKFDFIDKLGIIRSFDKR